MKCFQAKNPGVPKLERYHEDVAFPTDPAVLCGYCSASKRPGGEASESPLSGRARGLCFTEMTKHRGEIPFSNFWKLDFTLEIEMSYMLIDRWHSKTITKYIHHHTKYFNFQCKIQLDYTVFCYRDAKLDRQKINFVAASMKGRSALRWTML